MQRQCGKRKAGAAYLVTDVGDRGLPWTWFVIDPIKRVDPTKAGFSAQGLKIYGGPDGVNHVIDWIGAEYTPAAYIEEGIRYGWSGRAPANFPFELLGPKSFMFCYSAQAALLNPGEFYAARARQWCPNPSEEVRNEHLAYGPDQNDVTCAGLLWETLHGEPTRVPRTQLIKLACGSTFVGYCPPEGVTPQFTGGFFFRRPINRVEVVRDTVDHTHEQTLAKAKKAAVVVDLVEE